MKFRLVRLCIPLTALALLAGLRQWYPPELIPSDKFYLGRVAYFKENPVKGRVLMLGDSLTARGKWEKWLPDCGIVNRGIEFETTAGALARLDDVDRTGAQITVVMLGTNDVSRGLPLEGIVTRYRRIISHLAKKSRVFVISTPMHDRGQVYKNAKIADLNAQLKYMCQLGSCQFLNVNAIISPKSYTESRYLMDGTHLSPIGYHQVVRMIRLPLGCYK